MQRRQIEARLALYDDLHGILGAMRSYALAELRQVIRREEAQQQVVGVLAGALGELAFSLPPGAAPAGDVWLLLGSARGFCGSFDEDVMREWRRAGRETMPVVVAGERLQGLMPAQTAVLCVAGAIGGTDAPAAIDRILRAVAEARRGGAGLTGLVACYRDETAARTQRLLPLPALAAASTLAPLTNEPPARVAAAVAEHYLFHSLLALLLRSVMVENHMRLMQMESALSHLDEGRESLKRQRNRLRQEEIVEEIEVMVCAEPGLR